MLSYVFIVMIMSVELTGFLTANTICIFFYDIALAVHLSVDWLSVQLKELLMECEVTLIGRVTRMYPPAGIGLLRDRVRV